MTPSEVNLIRDAAQEGAEVLEAELKRQGWFRLHPSVRVSDVMDEPSLTGRLYITNV